MEQLKNGAHRAYYVWKVITRDEGAHRVNKKTEIRRTVSLFRSNWTQLKQLFYNFLSLKKSLRIRRGVKSHDRGLKGDTDGIVAGTSLENDGIVEMLTRDREKNTRGSHTAVRTGNFMEGRRRLQSGGNRGIEARKLIERIGGAVYRVLGDHEKNLRQTPQRNRMLQQKKQSTSESSAHISTQIG